MQLLNKGTSLLLYVQVFVDFNHFTKLFVNAAFVLLYVKSAAIPLNPNQPTNFLCSFIAHF